MIASASLSDTGLKRKANQDCHLADSELGLYLVADGMGGHAAGGIASKLTVDNVSEFVRLANQTRELTWPFGYDVRIPFEYNVLKTALRLANAKVCQVADQQHSCAGMGSTAVVVWIVESQAFYAHLGDSRIYLIREGRLRQLTEDHSLVQEQLNMGMINRDQARDHALRNVVTQAVGVRNKLDIEVHRLDLAKDDRLMLATDGLTDSVDDSALLEILSREGSLNQACQDLVEAANEAGGRDNITVILLHHQV